MVRIAQLAFAYASLLLVAPYALAAQYNFINIADSRGPLDGFGFTSQAVSDTGTVAFSGSQAGVTGTYLGSGGAVQQVVSNIEPPPAGFIIYNDLALNASGVAVRTASGDFGYFGTVPSIAQRFDASGTSTIAYESSGSPQVFFYFGEPAINSSGAVAFGTRISDFTNEPYIHRASLRRWFNGTSTTLVDTSEGFETISWASLNEQGDAAFAASTRPGGPGTSQSESLYRTDGTTLTLIAGPFDNALDLQLGRPVINDSGAVAFFQETAAGGEGIFVGDGGPLATVAIADPTTPFVEFETDIDINNHGTVAFTARLWNGSYGIYAGGDPVNDKVVEIGDFLFGQRVSGLGRPHLNNRGDIEFWFEVLDPREPFGYWSGIALAAKESALTGDYNGNGIVDAADYTIWRNNVGGTSLINRSTGISGPIGAADYSIWKANFGETLGSGSAGASPSRIGVPEPPTLALAAVGVLVLPICRRRRCRGE